jgi:uncharacterized protein (TIGR02246 family)
MVTEQQAQASIRTTYERLATAWAVGDAAALGSLVASDCDHTTVGATSHVKRGRAELVESWEHAFKRRCPRFSVKLEPSLHSIRLLGGNLALVDGKLDYTGGVGPRGVPQRPVSQSFSAVMTLSDADWLMLSIRVGGSRRPD